MRREEIEDLLERYANGTVTDAEKALVESWYDQFTPAANRPDPEHLAQDQKESLARLMADIDGQRNRKIGPWYMAAAAVLMMFSAFGVYHFINGKKHPGQQYSVKTMPIDIAPGSDKAILTLGNGQKIDISDNKTGTIATQAGVQIDKTADGQVQYQPANEAAHAAVDFNTISVPRGGKYELVLADGTKVWLNSASSLKFPTVFSDGERVVELRGEAFFDVAHNAKTPFKVKTASQMIMDIGTQFDINAYTDEDAAATTLVEGSVKIVDARGQTLIKPGQQYLLKNNGSSEVKNDIDIDEVTAWKNGMFQFNNADIKTIMRQVSRWYNVDVEYVGQVPASTYHGRISRNSNASTVLKILALSGINFTIERGKIIVK